MSDTYHTLNEPQHKPKPRRQHTVIPIRKRPDETNDVQIQSEKRKVGKKNIVNRKARIFPFLV